MIASFFARFRHHPMMAGLAIAFGALAAGRCHAATNLEIFVPRGGIADFRMSGASGQPWKLVTADTDETKTMNFTSAFLGQLWVNFTAGDSSPAADSGGLITQPPHSVDGLDWAAAMAVYNPAGQMEFYFQMRSAGSSAVIDSAGSLLAVEASFKGLWSSPGDYFEFPLGHAMISQTTAPGSGPGSFVSSAMPEPTGGVLLCLGATIAAGALRLTARRRVS